MALDIPLDDPNLSTYCKEIKTTPLNKHFSSSQELSKAFRFSFYLGVDIPMLVKKHKEISPDK